jgi:hypothetical protein
MQAVSIHRLVRGRASLRARRWICLARRLDRFEFIRDDPAGPVVCTAAEGSRDLTHTQKRTYQALIAAKALEFSQPLPFTDLPLYDWMVESIDGIRMVEDTTWSFCCAPTPVQASPSRC